MATRQLKKDQKYVEVLASFTGEYGHIDVTFYEIPGLGCLSLKANCQTDPRNSESYGHRYGFATNYGLMTENDLRAGQLILRRIRKFMDAEYDAQRRASNFAEFSVQVMRALGISRAYIKPSVTLPHFGPLTSLPSVNPAKDADDVVREILKLEHELLRMRRA